MWQLLFCWAATVVAFGLLLRNSTYKGSLYYQQVYEWALSMPESFMEKDKREREGLGKGSTGAFKTAANSRENSRLKKQTFCRDFLAFCRRYFVCVGQCPTPNN
jgi:hypothetical protein